MRIIEGDGDLWSAPDNAVVCEAIREMGGVELKPSGRVEAIERVEDGWRVEGKECEAVVVASHGPSLAATAVAAAPRRPAGAAAAPTLPTSVVVVVSPVVLSVSVSAPKSTESSASISPPSSSSSTPKHDFY